MEYLYKLQEDDEDSDEEEPDSKNEIEDGVSLGKRESGVKAKKILKGKKKVKLNIEFEEDDDEKQIEQNEALKETEGF